MDIIDKIINMNLKQKYVAEKTGLSASHVSELLTKKIEPSKHVRILLELAFGERNIYKNPKIEAVAQIMEQLDESAQADILKCAEKEKLFSEALREKKKAA